MAREDMVREIELLRSKVDHLLDECARLETLANAPDNRNIFEAVPSGIVHVNAAGDIVYANVEAQRLLSLSPAPGLTSYIATSSMEVFCEDGSVCGPADYPVARCLRTGESQGPVPIGLRVLGANAISWVLVTAVPIQSYTEDGERHGVVVTLMDITERMQARQQRELFAQRLRRVQKMEAVGRLANGVAHDINNILSVITSVARITKAEGCLTTDAVEDLDMILQACERGSDLTQNLLGFVRQQPERRERFDVRQICREVSSVLGRTLKKITLTLSLSDESAWVEGSPGQLSHSLMNLCLNAADATGMDGEVCITVCLVTAHRELPGADGLADGGRYVRLSVADNGEGMDAEVQQQAFEPFFTTKAEGEGTGLGLWMVYSAVQHHGGHIILQSAPGRGTTVTIYIPSVCHANAPGASEGMEDELTGPPPVIKKV